MYIKHTTALDLLLTHACGNPEDMDEHVAASREGRTSRSIVSYILDLHCIKVEVRARLKRDGVMNQETGQWTRVPQYGIISVQPAPIGA